MKALLWKDCRLNRLVLVLGGLILVGPYVTAIVWMSLRHWPQSHWGITLATTSGITMVVSQLTVVLLGGNVIACERVDRSAEFLAYLPPSRAMIVASKAVMSLGSVMVILGTNLLIFYVLIPQWFGEIDRRFSAHPEPLDVAMTGVLFFGAGWMASSFLESPTFAIGIGFLAPAAVASLLRLSSYFWDRPEMDDFVAWYQGACVAVGIACFVTGTWYYVRRVEP